MHHTPKLILIADGDARSCRTMEQRLHDAQYRVNTVASGDEVLQHCEIDPPDILILDVELVDMDGYEVCEKLRSDLLCEEMTIILLTPPNDDVAGVYPAHMVDFAGGDFFLAKPYDPFVLIQLLDDLTEDPVAQSASSPPAFPTRVTWPTSRPRALVTMYSPR
ncbi:MAG: response regulator [Planctomycetes bacterium]|nr:response regulator [Planctomycetota bacterium]